MQSNGCIMHHASKQHQTADNIFFDALPGSAYKLHISLVTVLKKHFEVKTQNNFSSGVFILRDRSEGLESGKKTYTFITLRRDKLKLYYPLFKA